MKVLLVINAHPSYFDAPPFDSSVNFYASKYISEYIKNNRGYEVFSVIDNHHPKSTELSFVPPHCIETLSQPLCSSVFNGRVTKFTKHVPSALSNQTLLSRLKEARSIEVCGFQTSFDIIATAYDLMGLKSNFIILRNLCGDVSQELKNIAFQLMIHWGVPVSDIFP